MYYFILILGALFVPCSVVFFIYMYVNKELTLLNAGKTIGAFLLGVLMLVITLPSLKYMLLKEYDVVKGDCVIEISSSGRSAEATLDMLDTNELFSFTHIPELDAYGKSIPYYCEVTVSKDHMFEIGYKIYDVNSRQLLLTSE